MTSYWLNYEPDLGHKPEKFDIQSKEGAEHIHCHQHSSSTSFSYLETTFVVMHGPFWCLMQLWKKSMLSFLPGIKGVACWAGQYQIEKKETLKQLGMECKNFFSLSPVSLNKNRGTEKRKSDSAWKFSVFSKGVCKRWKKIPLNYVFNILKCNSSCYFSAL